MTLLAIRERRRLYAAVFLLCGPMIAHGCGGDAFTANAPRDGADSGTPDRDSGAGSGGATGNGPDGGVRCLGPEDCDDGDPCTVDVCGADAKCIRDVPRCGPTQSCCDGDCGECCADSECDDGVECTVDRCDAGYCTHSGDDTACDDGYYCAPDDGCRPRESCASGSVTPCDDGKPCTTDRCENQLCYHDDCAEGTVCCPGIGCAQCCTDSQCSDGDACTADRCIAGRCENPPLCQEGATCCRSSDGTASCGAVCCSASDCDDGVACTDDACNAGQCSNTPNAARCDADETCTIPNGCVPRAECTTAGDCPTSINPCQTVSCVGGKCEYSGCAADERCCQEQGCIPLNGCCTASECNDNVACTADACTNNACTNTPDHSYCSASGAGSTCDPRLGCVTCTSNAQCNDNNLCTQDLCQNGRCTYVSAVCQVGQYCCRDTGLCSYCCNDCDCNGIIAAQGSYPEGYEAPIPPPTCGICVSGMCQYSTLCGC